MYIHTIHSELNILTEIENQQAAVILYRLIREVTVKHSGHALPYEGKPFFLHKYRNSVFFHYSL